MSAKHTPGPWSQHLVKVQRDICGPQGQSIAYTRGAHWSGDRSEAEDFANALLIAASPELLDTLRAVVAFWDAITMEDAVNDLHVKARAIIAKATGSAS
ncbi:hypothetical protein ACQ858_08270 [Variovorax ureilyticus]|uniref:hypothetical protein n=1 Tax=Variovorax ureilyticus TaxID=1836198 RepID=UPI003D664827